MTQRVIDVDGVPTLFSPVLAHALEPGDLIATPFADMPTTRVDAVARSANHWGLSVLIDTSHGTLLEEALNAPVLRAVGARAGRVGTR